MEDSVRSKLEKQAHTEARKKHLGKKKGKFLPEKFPHLFEIQKSTLV